METPLDTQALLFEHFGFSQFRGGQEEVISRLLEGHSSLAVFPTGSGKSLCYQLPALLLPGMTLVVSPLIALMKDQVESLQRRGIAAARLDSSLTGPEAIEVYQRMHRGQLKILFVAPERFANQNFLNRLQTCRISLLAVDEAHCISEWGHAFRPDYLKIAQAADQLALPLRLALTATATPRVSADICQSFGIAPQNHIQTGFARPNLSLHVTPVEEEERDALLLRRLQSQPNAPTIVYVTKQFTTERLTTYLKREGSLKVRSYHAGMNMEVRESIQEEFMEGRCHIIVATIAFGMGIDKADIRAIYHYNLPKSLENYVQETGRAGRDGAPSRCELLACAADLPVLENFVFSRRPSASSIHSLVEHCLGRPGEIAVNRYEMSVAFDIKTEVIQSILVWLELEGYLVSGGWKYGSYRAKLTHSMEQLLAGHNPARVRFLGKLFETAKEGRGSYTFEIRGAAEALGESEEKILRALQWLETHGDLSLQPSQFLLVFTPTQKAQEKRLKEIAQEVDAYFADWEKRELGRLNTVTDLMTRSDCLDQAILSYFGEKETPPCGRCSACLGTSPSPLTSPDPLDLPPSEVQKIHALASEKHAALRAPRQLAKFLCGQTSPASTRARLTTQHELFGSLEHYPFRDVLAQCEVTLA